MSSKAYDLRAKQFHTGSAVHLPSHWLQPIDVGLDGPRSRHPSVQGVDRPDAQDRPEAQHQATHRRESRTVPLQRRISTARINFSTGSEPWNDS
jgi:hypothetical protein